MLNRAPELAEQAGLDAVTSDLLFLPGLLERSKQML